LAILPNSVGFTRLTLANDFGGGFEETHQLLGHVGVAVEDPLYGLPHHLPQRREVSDTPPWGSSLVAEPR
jgi:hypothetical protein